MIIPDLWPMFVLLNAKLEVSENKDIIFPHLSSLIALFIYLGFYS